MAEKKIKFTFPQLALMDWLLENPGRRFFVRSSGHGVWLYEMSELGEDGKRDRVRIYPGSSSNSKQSDLAILERLGGRDSIDTLKFYQAEFVNTYNPVGFNEKERDRYNRFNSQFRNENWHFQDHIYVPTKTMRAFWEDEGHALYEAALAKRMAEREAVERLVIIGRKSRIVPSIPQELASKVPEGMKLPIPSRSAIRPSYIARVVKETTGRLYVKDVVSLRKRSLGEDYNYIVQGREPNLYVSRDDVIVDYADRALANRLMEIDDEHQADLDKIAAEAIREILPALSYLNSKFLQKDAEREDMFREALDEHEQKLKGGAPKP